MELMTKEMAFLGQSCLILFLFCIARIVFSYNDNLYKKNLRLNGIDSPELHSEIAEEAELCKAGQKFLSDLILDKIIRVAMGGNDKYGRVLSSIYTHETNEDIIQKLIDEGFVRPYDGGHKDAWNLKQ